MKRRFYAEIGVRHAWNVDPDSRTLSVSRLQTVGDQHKWLELGIYSDERQLRAEPFEDLEIDLAAWWDGLADLDSET